jgi:hypothetical protein
MKQADRSKVAALPLAVPVVVPMAAFVVLALLEPRRAWAADETPEITAPGVELTPPPEVATPVPLEATAPLVASPAESAAMACAPLATVRGPRADAEALTRELVARGVPVEPDGFPPGPCPRTAVSVVRADGALRVTITDGVGRRAERSVSSVATAATLVESWLRLSALADADPAPVVAAPAPVVAAPAPSPAPPPAPSRPTPLVAREPTSTDVAVEATPDAPAERVVSRWLVDASGEYGMARDRTRWSGGRVRGCVRLGPVCVGPMFRVAGNDRQEKLVEGYLQADLPLRFGAVSLRPAIALGAGAMYERFGAGRGPDEAFDRDREEERYTPRAEVSLTASYALFERWHLTLGGAVTGVALGGGRFERVDDHQTTARMFAGLTWGVP